MTKCSRGAASSFARSLVHGDASVAGVLEVGLVQIGAFEAFAVRFEF